MSGMEVTIAACAADIDELVEAFAEIEGTELLQMKELWRARNFSFIHDARPKDILPSFYMQCLYSAALNHVSSGDESVFAKVGAVYVLYILYETQLFHPRFKIYLSLEDLEAMRNLLKQLKFRYLEMALKVVHKMFVNKVFLYGSVAVDQNRIAAAATRLAGDVASRLARTRSRLLGNASLRQHVHGNLVDEPLLNTLVLRTKAYVDARHEVCSGNGALLEEEREGLRPTGAGFGDVLKKEVDSWVAQRSSITEEQVRVEPMLLDNQERASPSSRFSGDGAIDGSGFPGFLDDEDELDDAEERAYAAELNLLLDEV